MAVDRDEEFSAYAAASRPTLWRAAYLLCGNVAQADDLVQNATLKLYVAWPRLVREDRIDGHSRRIIVNAHIDETRRLWRRETEALDGHEPATEPTDDEHTGLIRALKALPAGQRRVVVLRHYWGMSVAETAADLGISQGTVKSQKSRLDIRYPFVVPRGSTSPDCRPVRSRTTWAMPGRP